MKIVLFGLGSIGMRHARLLKEDESCEIHAFRSKKKGNALDIPEITRWCEFDDLQPDVAFITNPTHLHIETALACAERDTTLFLEKPIGHSVEGLEGLLKLVEDKKIPSYVAYVLRFHPAVSALKTKLIGQKIRKVRLICNSFFPAWRPGQNHLESYAARHETGGGALLELSHEFDLVSYLLGPIETIDGCLEKRASVTVNAEDFVDASIQTAAGKAEILINTAAQNQERKIFVETEDESMIIDLMEPLYRDIPFQEQLRYFKTHVKEVAMMNSLPEAAPLFKKMIQFREKAFVT